MKKLIINADDFGYREGINRGIIYAHQNGLVTSASLFTDREGTDEAVRLARENPALSLGLHLDLDRYFMVEHGVGQITGWIDPKPPLSAVKDESRRQLDRFATFGFTADHIDSHHHSHLNPEVFPLICDLAREYHIPVIRLFEKHFADAADYDSCRRTALEHGLKFVDHFLEGWYWGNVDEAYQCAELMTHPGYGEIWREAELAHCCQPKLKQYFIEQQIELLCFGDAFPGA